MCNARKNRKTFSEANRAKKPGEREGKRNAGLHVSQSAHKLQSMQTLQNTQAMFTTTPAAAIACNSFEVAGAIADELDRWFDALGYTWLAQVQRAAFSCGSPVTRRQETTWRAVVTAVLAGDPQAMLNPEVRGEAGVLLQQFCKRNGIECTDEAIEL